jgi:Gram-negative bacterial TonB protein C-terminal
MIRWTRLAPSIALSLIALACAGRPAAPRVTAAGVSSETVTPPQPLNSPRVQMPQEMQGKECTSGLAVAEVLVGTDGRVSRARLVKQSGADLFDVACLSNASRRVFRPGQKNGRSVEATASITCHLECR